MADSITPTAVSLPEVIAVGELAQKLELPVTTVISELMRNGVMATINEQIDYDTAAIIASDLGFAAAPEVADNANLDSQTSKLEPGEGVPRPPIVAVMGHVDHGKTSLLDAIRETAVAAGEAGGITQHIGAYQVKRPAPTGGGQGTERWITFLDTPGHEAFSALRAHGARMTDVAIIVVAADDGVKPQTREAIEHARAAGVQMVIAINKVDKPGADPNRVRQQLSELELVPEEWGGKTVMVDVSAKSGQGIEQLLDLVLLVADIEELRTRPDGPSEGIIIESHLESGRGPIATLLVAQGVLRSGDALVAGSTYAKVRSLEDWRGRKLKQASGGMPAVVVGFKAVPAFGDLFRGLESEKVARTAAEQQRRSESIKSLVKTKKIGVEELQGAITAGRVNELNVVVKADVQGSLESLADSLNGLRNDEVAVKIVSSGVGDISESDIGSARAAGAIVLGFNVGLSSPVRQLANRENVQVRQYKVIYELLDNLREALSQMLPPEVVEIEAGRLEVLGVFKTTRTSVVCGGRVTAGKVEPKLQVRVWRKKEELGTGTVVSLQKEKQAAKEVVEGEQCGMNIETTAEIAVGDELQFFTTESRARSL